MTAPEGSRLRPGDRIVVTGGAGFIGTQLVRRLLREGMRVRVLDDLSAGGSSQSLGAETVVGSVLDAAAVRAALAGADLLLHLASVVGHRRVATDRQYCYRVATEGTRQVLRSSGDTPVVIFSSSAVYGLSTSLTPLNESAVADREALLAMEGNVAGYSVGKWDLERRATRVARRRPILIVRPFNIIGATQRSGTGMVLPSFIEHALAGRALEIYDDGLQCRSFGHVSTFVDCIMRLLRTDNAWPTGGTVVNIGNPEPTRILDLAQAVVRCAKRPLTVQTIPYSTVFPGSRDVRARIPDTTRLTGLIGPVSWPILEDIVEEAVQAAMRRHDRPYHSDGDADAPLIHDTSCRLPEHTA